MLGRVVDELSASCEVIASCGVGEQAVVSDAHESRRQDVEQEAAEEFLDVESHEALRALRTIVATKGHGVVIEGDESVIGDGHAVGIPSQVAQHLSRSRKGWLAVNNPVFAGGNSKSSMRVVVVAGQGLVVETRFESAKQLGSE